MSVSHWSSRDHMDERLIKLVSELEELYNPSNKKYSDNLHKFKTWRKIGQTLMRDPEDCKKRWESLRHQFRKVCRTKRKMSEDDSIQPTKKWKYEDELAFLLPFMRQNQPNLTLEKDDDYSNDLRSNDSIHTEEYLEIKVEPDVGPSDYINYQQQSVSSFDQAIVGSSDNHDKIKYQGFSSKYDAPSETSVELTQTPNFVKFIEQKIVEENLLRNKDEVDYFFDAIKATVRKFSASDIHDVKRKIFNLVSEVDANYIKTESKPPGLVMICQQEKKS